MFPYMVCVDLAGLPPLGICIESVSEVGGTPRVDPLTSNDRVMCVIIDCCSQNGVVCA